MSGVASPSFCPLSIKWEVRDAYKDRCRFHMSIKFEKMELSSVRDKIGFGLSRETIKGCKKCYFKHSHHLLRDAEKL
jgi:hypothetical protein